MLFPDPGVGLAGEDDAGWDVGAGDGEGVVGRLGAT